MCDVLESSEEVQSRYSQCPWSALCTLECAPKDNGLNFLIGYKIESNSFRLHLPVLMLEEVSLPVQPIDLLTSRSWIDLIVV
jgi:hypothetical protein